MPPQRCMQSPCSVPRHAAPLASQNEPEEPGSELGQKSRGVFEPRYGIEQVTPDVLQHAPGVLVGSIALVTIAPALPNEVAVPGHARR